MTSTKQLMLQLPDDDTTSTEPSLMVGSITSAVVGVVGLIATALFHKHFTEDQLATVYAVVGIFLPVLTSFLIRKKVWSPASVAAVVKELGNRNLTAQKFVKPEDFFKRTED